MINGLLWFLSFVGHVGLWCVIFNRVHATAFPRKIRKLSEKVVLLAVGLPMLWVLVVATLQQEISFESFATYRLPWLYAYGSVLLGCYFVLRWVWRKWYLRLPRRILKSQCETINVGREIGFPYRGTLSTLLGSIPFNEASLLTLQRMSIQVSVPESLDGLRICQLSDLHFTGQIDVEYFHRVIQAANEFDPDLVVITGDLIDELHCFDWIKSTLGKLNSKYGVYYVLGNHDLRINDEPRLRSHLKELGLTQVSGEWVEVSIGDATIRMTGNELPWFNDVERLPARSENKADLEILLSHSPDQVDWAKSRGFDLMFAGHTHGGQIAFPVIGPIVAPSKYGVLYASGTFQIGDMIMHVSRGLSGDEPIRFCSPPELGLFTLVRGNDR